ncbi:MAG: DUF2520 domain-containing protein [bacterium]|nr:DUF2520 domain-containing protein [bacterium]
MSARPGESDAGPVGIAGLGAAGTALAAKLAAAGVPLVLYARTTARAEALATSLGATAAGELEELGAVSTVWLAVSDRAIGSVAAEIASRVKRPKAAVALHASGFYDETPLAPLADAGWKTGGAHPLVSLPPGSQDVHALDSAWFALCGDPRARRRARELIACIGGHELALVGGADAKRRYHAAASLLAGGLASLFDVVEEELDGAVKSPRVARAAFAALAGSVLDNLATRGAAASMTGPVVRGDVEVLRGQLELMGPHARRLYEDLLGRVVRLALERGSLDAAQAQAIWALLDE